MPDGSVSAQLTRVIAGAETGIGNAVNISGLTYNPGDTLRVEFQTSGTGSTTLQAKVWKAGGATPASWQLTGTDSTAALQVPGGVALLPYLSGSSTNAPVTVSIDNLTVQALQEGPADGFSGDRRPGRREPARSARSRRGCFGWVRFRCG